jgi:two-component system nitrogen regulation response regulator NtrX
MVQSGWRLTGLGAHLCACERGKAAWEHTVLRAADDDNLGLVGVSTYMQQLRQEIRTVAAGEFPVLIQGDSGTGKELIAAAVHRCSSRRDRTLVAVNCAAIPAQLEEAEFFGHTRGAFTGADRPREGLVARAHQSTLFLDEIAETSLEVQAKLLRALDTGDYKPVGSAVGRQVDIRVVSATNRDLEILVGQGRFREDLYYRLKGVVLTARPLRQHHDDIRGLVEHFLKAKEAQDIPREVSAEALALLQQYEWPGNVRELRYTVEVLCVAASGTGCIEADTVQRVLNLNQSDMHPVHERYGEAKAQVLHEFETRYFTQLLREYRGNVTRVAEAAGMHRPNVVRKLKALGVDSGGFRGA